MELFDLTGRTAVITGGNGGLGLAMARGLAKAGANVAIWARNADKNNAAFEELYALDRGRPLVTQCDIAVEDDIEDAMAMTLDVFGRVDVCFANAGISGAGTAIPISPRKAGTIPSRSTRAGRRWSTSMSRAT